MAGFPFAMTKQTLSAHSALTAIAAGLVLASTPALAQVTDTAPAEAAPAPIVVPSAQPAPAMPGPATTVTLPQITVPAPSAAPTVAAAPTLPEVAPQQSARAEAAPAPVRRAAPTEARAAAPAARPAARPATVTPVVTPAPVQSAAPINEAPVTPVVEQPVEQAAPAPVTRTNEPSGNEALWVVGGAGAALLAGVGALVYFSRRRRGAEAYEETGFDSPSMAREPEPVFATPGFSVAPAIPVSAADEPVTAPAWSPATTALARGDQSDDLEAMVAQAPSQENPFLTRKKRLRRAEYLLHKGHTPETFVDEPVAARDPVAPAKEKARQPVYNFANGPVSFRPQGWKPATT